MPLPAFLIKKVAQGLMDTATEACASGSLKVKQGG